MSDPSAPPPYATAVEDKKFADQPYPTTQPYPTGQPYYNTQYGAAPSSGSQPPPPTGYAPYPQAGPPQPQPQPYVYPAEPPASTVYSAPVGSSSPESGGFTTRESFGDKDVRRMFVRKVFIVLGLQLLVTFGIVTLFTLVDGVSTWVRAHSWTYYISYAIFLVLYFVLVCVESARRKSPHNIIMLGLFTLALSYMTGIIAAFHSTQAVMITMGVTAVVCLGIILFSIQTRFDFTKCSGVLFVLVMVLFLFGFITIFTYHSTWYIQVVYGCLGALVFSLFLAFDTQLVMGGRKYELEPEEYIYGALTLYIDIVYIFIFLLSIFSGSNN